MFSEDMDKSMVFPFLTHSYEWNFHLQTVNTNRKH